MFFGSAAVFPVSDMAASLAYFRDILGFGVEFSWGSPPNYVCLGRDDVALHLVSGRQAGQNKLCCFVRDVDALHAEYAAKGATILEPPQTYAYGMREFVVADPDGNQLVLGRGVEAVGGD
jgi:catechol 2,3-dioxygenase-like lactoylglutathione lyase family enzyme